MRCVNCGYDNGPGYSACIKCGQPLQAFEQPSYNPTPQGDMLGGTVIGQSVERNAPRPTVIVGSNAVHRQQERETVIFRNESGQKTQLVSPTPCPQCGYTIVANHTNCPRCGASLAGQKNPVEEKVMPVSSNLVMEGTFKCVHCQNEIPLNSLFCSFCGQRVHPPTVLPGQMANMRPAGPSCFLTMLPEEGEVLDKVKKEYIGESVILNRLNTDETNCTITTQKQAELKCEDGEWYLQNLSELQTTYLVLNRKIQLEEGDIIVMGNRKFKFEKKK